MPIFGDDINEMMNSKSNYPMVFSIIIKAIEDLSDDEKDDFYIKDTDALIVAGKVVRILIKIRKNNTRVFRFIFMSKKEITCTFITKSCFHLSH